MKEFTNIEEYYKDNEMILLLKFFNIKYLNYYLF